MKRIAKDVPDASTLTALLAAPGVGYVSANEVLSAARQANASVADLVAMEASDLAERCPEIRNPSKVALGAGAIADFARAHKLLDRVTRSGAQIVLRTDADYPQSMLDSRGKNAPPVLTVIGDLSLLSKDMAAVVGARSVTPEGRSLAAQCAKVWAAREVVVVSGAAKGADRAAHDAALAAGGDTVYVLPEGILRQRVDRKVLDAAESGRAAIVSEHRPDRAFSPQSAFMRNTTICGMSSVVCVVEPGDTGGSRQAAHAALDLGVPTLVHCAAGHLETERELRERGALALPYESRDALATALADAWDNRRCGEQGDLFSGGDS